MPMLYRNPWLSFLLPLVVYMLVGSLEPTPHKPGGLPWLGLTIDYGHFPLVYTIKLVAAAVAIALVWPAWHRFPLRVGWLGPAVGVVGVLVWVGLCELRLEERFLLPLEQRYLVPLFQPVGFQGFIASGERSAFNPLEFLAATPAWAYAFLAIRFAGLVLIVPLIEEFCYRGFVMRYPVRHEWWDVPLGETNKTGIALAIAVPVLMHPAELAAALVWFSLIAWLYIRTRSIWECVVAHAVTNLLLGGYVLFSGKWELM